MSPELSAALVGAAGTLIPSIIVGSIGYGKLETKIDSLHERLKRAEDWIVGHDKDATQIRATYDVRMTSFEVRLGRGEEKFEQISNTLDEIKNDLRALLGRRREDRENRGE